MNPVDEYQYAMHVQQLEDIIRTVGEPLEGNCVYEHQTLNRNAGLAAKQRNLFRAAQGASRICEIGFNAGHSALLFVLAANPASTFLFFDLGEHAYTRPATSYIQTRFPTMSLEFQYGNSLTQIPRWLEANRDQQGTYDVVHVDGGHTKECITSDLLCGYLLAKPGGLVIVDDLQDKGILESVNMWVREGYLVPVGGFEPTTVYPHVVLQKKV